MERLFEVSESILLERFNALYQFRDAGGIRRLNHLISQIVNHKSIMGKVFAKQVLFRFWRMEKGRIRLPFYFFQNFIERPRDLIEKTCLAFDTPFGSLIHHTVLAQQILLLSQFILQSPSSYFQLTKGLF